MKIILLALVVKNLSSKRRLETHIIGCIEYSLNTQKEKYEHELKQQQIRFQNLITEKDKRIKDLEDRMDSLLLKAVSYNYIDEDPRVIEIYMDEDDSSHVVDTETTPIIIEEKSSDHTDCDFNKTVETVTKNPINITKLFNLFYCTFKKIDYLYNEMEMPLKSPE